MLARRGHAVTLYERSAATLRRTPAAFMPAPCSRRAARRKAPSRSSASSASAASRSGGRPIPAPIANGTLVVALASRPRRARPLRPHDRRASAPVAGRACRARAGAQRPLRRRALLCRGGPSRAGSRLALPARCASLAEGVALAPRRRREARGRRSRHRLPGPRRQGRSSQLARRARRADRGQEPRRDLDAARAPAASALSALRRALGRRSLYDRRHGDRERGDGRHHAPLGARSPVRGLCASIPPSPRPRSCGRARARRPAFPDNRPRIIARKGYIYVNGLYRHGFLLAPVLAELVAAFIETGATDPEVFR